jgi:hypothetical protein
MWRIQDPLHIMEIVHDWDYDIALRTMSTRVWLDLNGI